MSPPAPASPSAGPPSWEWWLVVAATLVGAVVRVWNPGSLGLTHFDEGIYALAGLWFASPSGLAGLDPMVVPYAPAGFPVLVGASSLVLGIGDLAAIAPSLVTGTATIPVAAWLGRRTSGPGAGSATAWLVALAGPHVAFSRMALTDATFGLAWLVALGLGQRFLERPTLLRALPFGLAVGLAQNVKYNGILTGVIVALAAAGGSLHRRPDVRSTALRAMIVGLVALLAAGLAYWPWYRFVEAHGGYSALLAHQRSYFGGWSRWPASARLQVAQWVALSGSVAGPFCWGGIAAGLACLSAATAVRGSSSSQLAPGRAVLRSTFVAATAVVLIGVFPEWPWWLGLASLPWLLAEARPAVRVIGLWWLVMSVLTPFYHPYARLGLPLHLGCWLIAGGMARDAMVWAIEGSAAEPGSRRPSWLAPSLVAVLLCVLARGSLLPQARPWTGLLDGEDGVRLAAERLAEEVRRTNPAPAGLRTYARPPVLYYLGTRVGVPFTREGSLSSLEGPSVAGRWDVADSRLVETTDPSSLPRWERQADLSIPFAVAIPTELDERPDRALRSDAPGPSADDRRGMLLIRRRRS